MAVANTLAYYSMLTITDKKFKVQVPGLEKQAFNSYKIGTLKQPPHLSN
jgi:hypothetical protein